jgi:hypothetical protein
MSGGYVLGDEVALYVMPDGSRGVPAVIGEYIGVTILYYTLLVLGLSMVMVAFESRLLAAIASVIWLLVTCHFGLVRSICPR